ncbi:Fur family transcriptional regulator [Geminicoccus flavidas]|uniref:Fur family transcriptional regulator n=1 Tax=Geminicoccus flavidas TaxID=2506407 RepID=UPI0013586FB5|nr:transcriptional repressor [Geminicoccus flavidas]
MHRVLLDLLRENERPIGAYTLVRMLSEKLKRGVSPPTLYQALSRLIQQGLVVRVERRDCYIATRHPGIASTRLFLICGHCDAVEEKLAPQLDVQLAEEAQASGFKIARNDVEVEGPCRCCADQVELSASHPSQTETCSPRRHRRLACSS